jgi:hypothetical protein
MKLFRDSGSRLCATPQCPAKKAWRYVGLLAAIAITMPTSSPIYGQGTVAVSVVNMIPQALSEESGTDSEPNLAVNPSSTQNMAASAFTPNPMGGANAPIYISTDGGQNWALNSIVPGNAPPTGTHDITLRFGATSNVLYAGMLRGDATNVMNILRTNDFTSANTMTELVHRSGVDMPYVEAISVAGIDRVYVGNSNSGIATVDLSLDAATAPAPAGFTSQRIEARSSTCGKDGPSIRPAIHRRGTIYAAFFRWTQCAQNQFPFISDVVVVRDDHFARGPATFVALREPPPPRGDGMPGVRVVRSVPVPFGRPILGNQRVGSRISIAVEPSNKRHVYLAWGHGDAASYALYVRRSIDGGKSWSNDLRMIPLATNPSLAINSRGLVGFLYQKLTGTAPNQRWETHLERTDDAFATHTDLVLHHAPDNVRDASGAGPLGDYNQLLAVGRDFYGVFSGNNTPDRANFPHGVKYQRNANFTTGKLLAVDNVTEVDPSIDPFFFKVRESRRHR